MNDATIDNVNKAFNALRPYLSYTDVGAEQTIFDILDALAGAPGPQATPPANNIFNATFCKNCGELIRDDEDHGWVHVANPNLGSWYTYCEMRAGRPNVHIDSVATPDGRDYAVRDSDAKP